MILAEKIHKEQNDTDFSPVVCLPCPNCGFVGNRYLCQRSQAGTGLIRTWSQGTGTEYGELLQPESGCRRQHLQQYFSVTLVLTLPERRECL